jgi:hypothetical protein
LSFRSRHGVSHACPRSVSPAWTWKNHSHGLQQVFGSTYHHVDYFPRHSPDSISDRLNVFTKNSAHDLDNGGLAETDGK